MDAFLARRLSRRRLLAGVAGFACAGAFWIPSGFASGHVFAGEPQPADGAPAGGLEAASDQLFGAGWFPQADAGYAQILTADPANPHALAQRGYIALLSNRLADAQSILAQLLRLQPDDHASLQNLAEAYIRLDDFDDAAPLFQQLGQAGQAAMLESFAGLTPYAISGPDLTQIPFLQTDPLPVLEVSVNGSEPVPFAIDTGGGSLNVSPDLASRAGIPLSGTVHIMATGGLRASMQLGRIDSLALGDITVQSVPVWVPSNGPPGLRLADGRTTQGVLTTPVLRHFLATIDYRSGALILRRQTSELSCQFESDAAAAGAVPTRFWLAGDTAVVAHGTVNGVGPMLFLLDTGSAGTGFSAPQSTIAAAGIQPDESQAITLIGPGGTVRAAPFVVDELTLGGAIGFNVRGLTGAFASEYQFGFRIGGLIGHQFVRSYALTLNFQDMRLFLA